MAQPNFGTVGPFNPAIEDWISYEESFRFFLTVNEVTDDDKMQAIFLTTCGATTNSLVRSQAGSRTLSPEPSLAVQCFKFNSRSHQAGESVGTYLAELKRLSEHCNFGDALQDMLRDRLVCGIKDQRAQRRLLAESDLTL